MECYKVEGVDVNGNIVKFKDGCIYASKLVDIIKLDNELNTIHCYSNKLSSLPELPTSLDFLYCDDNQLSSLPSVLPYNLAVLWCQHNQIRKLPNLRECTKLEFVDCDLVCFETYMLDMDVDFDFYY